MPTAGYTSYIPEARWRNLAAQSKGPSSATSTPHQPMHSHVYKYHIHKREDGLREACLHLRLDPPRRRLRDGEALHAAPLHLQQARRGRLPPAPVAGAGPARHDAALLPAQRHSAAREPAASVCLDARRRTVCGRMPTFAMARWREVAVPLGQAVVCCGAACMRGRGHLRHAPPREAQLPGTPPCCLEHEVELAPCELNLSILKRRMKSAFPILVHGASRVLLFISIVHTGRSLVGRMRCGTAASGTRPQASPHHPICWILQLQTAVLW